VLEVGASQWALQIFDDVELDVALAQDLQRTARLTSTGVVVDDQFRHGGSPQCRAHAT
jgi:hypothetical protein